MRAPAIHALIVFVACGGEPEMTAELSSGAADSSDSESEVTGAESTTGDSEATGDGDTAAGDGDGDGTTSGDGSTGDGDGSSGDGDGASADELLLRAAIDGTVDPADALDTIANRDGLPVQTTAGTFLFACLCGPGTWSLAGDHDAWAGAVMSLSGALSWIEIDIASPDGSLYKFTDGAATWIADPRGRRHGYDGFGLFSLVRASAAHLERWYEVSGFGLSARNLEVFVPADAVFDRVLYAHDAQNLFNPDAFWGGWQLDQSLPAATLVVGIDNTSARIDEYTHVVDGGSGGRANDYADLVELQIRPQMENAYGTATVVGVMGSSLGGLVAFHIADRFPDRYDMAISLSGTMGWGSIDPGQPVGLTMMDRYVAAGMRSTALYLDAGGGGTCVDSDGDGVEDDGANSDNYCVNEQLRDALMGLGYALGINLWHVHDPGAAHNEAAWAARVAVPLAEFAALPG